MTTHDNSAPPSCPPGTVPREALREAWAQGHRLSEKVAGLKADLYVVSAQRDFWRNSRKDITSDLMDLLRAIRDVNPDDTSITAIARGLDDHYRMGVWPLAISAEEMDDVRADDARDRVKDMTAEARALGRES